MEIELDSGYQLSQSFKSHIGAARCCHLRGTDLISGGIDNKVVRYERGQDGKFTKKEEYKFFKDFIYSVLILEDGDKFAVGCKDGNVYLCLFSDTENPFLVLEGNFVFIKDTLVQ